MVGLATSVVLRRLPAPPIFTDRWELTATAPSADTLLRSALAVLVLLLGAAAMAGWSLLSAVARGAAR